MKLLEGKVAIVTGGMRGIGKAISETFLKNGAKVLINFNKSKIESIKLKKEWDEKGYDFLFFQGSVTEEDNAREIVLQAYEKWGQIDILVNNAGITRDQVLMFLTEEEWDSVIDVNLNSVFALTKEVYKIMQRQKSGRIINISSLTALMGRDGQTNYGASKSGLIGFTKALAREGAEHNILVNAIAAGLIDTRMTKKMPGEIHDFLLKLIPLGRIGMPEEISNVVLYLASGLSTYTTGNVVNVTGGQYM